MPAEDYPVVRLANAAGTVIDPATGSSSGSGGSVTAAGTNGTQAQAVQGITNGVPQNVIVTRVTNGTSFIDRSGAVSSTIGANTVAVAATPARRFLQIQNPNPSAKIAINFGAAASIGGGSIIIAPGATVTYDSVVPTDSINVASDAGGAGYTIKEGL